MLENIIRCFRGYGLIDLHSRIAALVLNQRKECSTMNSSCGLRLLLSCFAEWTVWVMINIYFCWIWITWTSHRLLFFTSQGSLPWRSVLRVLSSMPILERNHCSTTHSCKAKYSSPSVWDTHYQELAWQCWNIWGLQDNGKLLTNWAKE